ncbi:MAG: hypothetical protein K0Q79_226 [Flavipsychrobacter sp.]|jgi:hypothetical protein|nr:hypothetical protein [Flavipsychrobacter sp.]
MTKTVFALLVAILLGVVARAQFAIEGGVNMANMAIKANGNKLSSKFKNGAAGGCLLDMPLGDHVYFQSGALYEMMGCKINQDPIKGEYTLHTIGIPLNLIYKTGQKCTNRLFIGAGLHLGYNLSGSYTISGGGQYIDTSYDLKFGSGEALKKVDIGMGVNFGYMLTKRFYFRFRYHFSMANLNKSEDKDNSLRTSAIGLNLGFLFGRCRAGGYADGFYLREGTHWRGMSKGVYSRDRKHMYKRYYKSP